MTVKCQKFELKDCEKLPSAAQFQVKSHRYVFHWRFVDGFICRRNCMISSGTFHSMQKRTESLLLGTPELWTAYPFFLALRFLSSEENLRRRIKGLDLFEAADIYTQKYTKKWQMIAHKSSWILVYWQWGSHQGKQNCPGCCWYGVKGRTPQQSDSPDARKRSKKSRLAILTSRPFFFCLKCLSDSLCFFEPVWFDWKTFDAWHVWHGRNLALTSRPIQCLQSGCDPVTNPPRLKTPPFAMVELSLEPRAIRFALGTTLLSGLLALRLGTLVLVVIGGVHGKLYYPTPCPKLWTMCPPDSLANFSHADDYALGLDSWSTLFVTGGCCPSKHASVTWREIEDIRWSYLMSIHCYLRFSPRCLVLRRFATAGPRSRGFFCGMKADLRIKNWEQLSFFNPLWIPFIVCT